jgi:outer membrane protein TolC
MTILSLLCIFTRIAAAQTAAPIELTLSKALERSLKSYPSVRVSQEQVNAAGAAIQLARTAYLPRIDALAQFDRATRNNVFGLQLPQNVIPSMSGPAIGTNNLGSVWGSAVGVLVTWEPFDFGLRRANVDTANTARVQSEAAVKRTQFDVLVATADAFLTVIAAGQTVQAAQAGVDRAQTLVKTVTAQVSARLRPGADQSRAEAEWAAARTQLVQAQQALDISRVTLAQFVGGDPTQIAISSGSLLGVPPETTPMGFNISTNPLAVEQSAVVEQTRAQLRALERTYFPRFSLQGAAYGRGTGAELDGQRLGGLNGLAPNVQDYAVGFSVTFPLFDLPAIHAREAAQNATIRAQVAKSEQIAVDLRAQWNRAVAGLNGARRIAGNTPVQVSAARAATGQATARYRAGLANIDELAEAQRLLTQAEIDDVLARLGVWRGLLGIAAAGGDIEPFVLEAMQ